MKQLNSNTSATEFVSDLNDNFAEVGVLHNKGVQTAFIGYLAQDGNWVKQKNIICPVAMGITYRFRLPVDVVAKVSYGSDTNPSNTSNNLFDGNTLTLPSTSNTQQIWFARYESGNVKKLTVSDAESLIASGAIAVEYDEKFDVLGRTYYQEQLFRAVKRVDKGIEYTSQRNIAPLIGHISDLHGDAQRAYNFFKWCAAHGIDTCVVSGDSVLYSGQGMDYIFKAANECGVHVCVIMGNHEAQSIATPSAGVMFSTYLSPYAEALGYFKAADTVTDRGYYYHDIPAKRIRVIVLDQYDGGVYVGQGKGGRISQGQIDFLVDTLNSTPNGYGIILSYHSQESSMSYPFTKFESARRSSTYAANGVYVDESRPIRSIIDAFIGRTTYNVSYSQTYNGSTENVSKSGTFADVDESVEFICYLSGHRHRDLMGYLSGSTNPQLLMQVTSGNANTRSSTSQYAFSEEDDLPRDGMGITQDAFNVYAIDRTNHQVRVVRIGSDTNFNFEKRDHLIANYASTTIPDQNTGSNS